MSVYFVVQIMGCDAIEIDGEFEWSDEHETITQVEFDTKQEAFDYLFGIDDGQVIAWEKESRCNGLDVIVTKEYYEDCGEFIRFDLVGEAEWIGTSLNGIWDEFERIK